MSGCMRGLGKVIAGQGLCGGVRAGSFGVSTADDPAVAEVETAPGAVSRM